MFDTIMHIISSPVFSGAVGTAAAGFYNGWRGKNTKRLAEAAKAKADQNAEGLAEQDDKTTILFAMVNALQEERKEDKAQIAGLGLTIATLNDTITKLNARIIELESERTSNQAEILRLRARVAELERDLLALDTTTKKQQDC